MLQTEIGNPQVGNLEKKNVKGLNSSLGCVANSERVAYSNSIFMFLKTDLTVKATKTFS